ncbi:MAG: C4-dicarboxylate ABC transporter substrate-binding protein, partial [Rhodobacteraceae bacterium]|nr:C4-dicarboxylate ABC transporter substrate-binding protein [Paracoccaceae bacterium]
MTYFSKALSSAAVAALIALTAGQAMATEFRIAVGDGAGGSQEALGNAFIAALQEQTGGAHTGKLFLNGQLGSEEDTVTAAALGTLDFSILAINNVTPFSP